MNQESTKGTLNKPIVLIIEDDQGIGQLLSEIITDDAQLAESRVASNLRRVREILDELNAANLQPQAICLDLRLGGELGLQALHEPELINVPVIVSSALLETDIISQAMKNYPNIRAFCPRPDVGELINNLREILSPKLNDGSKPS